MAEDRLGLPRSRRQLCGRRGPRRRVRRRRGRWCRLDECRWVLASRSRRTQSAATRLRCRCEPRHPGLSAPGVRLRVLGVARLLRRRSVRGGGVHMAKEEPLLRRPRVRARRVWLHRDGTPANHTPVIASWRRNCERVRPFFAFPKGVRVINYVPAVCRSSFATSTCNLSTRLISPSSSSGLGGETLDRSASRKDSSILCRRSLTSADAGNAERRRTTTSIASMRRKRRSEADAAGFIASGEYGCLQQSGGAPSDEGCCDADRRRSIWSPLFCALPSPCLNILRRSSICSRPVEKKTLRRHPGAPGRSGTVLRGDRARPHIGGALVCGQCFLRALMGPGGPSWHTSARGRPSWPASSDTIGMEWRVRCDGRNACHSTQPSEASAHDGRTRVVERHPGASSRASRDVAQLRARIALGDAHHGQIRAGRSTCFKRARQCLLPTRAPGRRQSVPRPLQPGVRQGLAYACVSWLCATAVVDMAVAAVQRASAPVAATI
jgi:hypothetical protein